MLCSENISWPSPWLFRLPPEFWAPRNHLQLWVSAKAWEEVLVVVARILEKFVNQMSPEAGKQKILGRVFLEKPKGRSTTLSLPKVWKHFSWQQHEVQVFCRFSNKCTFSEVSCCDLKLLLPVCGVFSGLFLGSSCSTDWTMARRPFLVPKDGRDLRYSQRLEMVLVCFGCISGCLGGVSVRLFSYMSLKSSGGSAWWPIFRHLGHLLAIPLRCCLREGVVLLREATQSRSEANNDRAVSSSARDM